MKRSTLAGGVLVYGIPEFRLPKAIVQKEVDSLKALGVEIETNMVIGKTLTVDELFEETAMRRCSSAPAPACRSFMNIPGENLKGVYSANEFLTRSQPDEGLPGRQSDTPIMHAKTRGGGRRRQRRDGRRPLRPAAWARRRSTSSTAAAMAEMPARKEEIHHAKEEGVRVFSTLTNPRGGSRESDTGIRHAGLHCVRDGAGRARRVRPPPPGGEAGQRV